MKSKVLLCTFLLATVLTFAACGGNSTGNGGIVVGDNNGSGGTLEADAPTPPPVDDDPEVVDDSTEEAEDVSEAQDEIGVMIYTRHSLKMISFPVYDDWIFAPTEENATITTSDGIVITIIPVDMDVTHMKEAVFEMSLAGFNPQTLIIAELQDEGLSYPALSATYVVQLGENWVNAMSFLLHGDDAFVVAHVLNAQVDAFDKVFDFITSVQFIN